MVSKCRKRFPLFGSSGSSCISQLFHFLKHFSVLEEERRKRRGEGGISELGGSEFLSPLRPEEFHHDPQMPDMKLGFDFYLLCLGWIVALSTLSVWKWNATAC